MGVDPSSFSLEHVDCMIELEIARHNLVRKEHVIEEMVVTLDQVLLLGFGEKEEDEDGFTLVISRRSQKAAKSAYKIRLRGAQSKSSATSVKVNNYHPLCDVVTGHRERKKNPIYT
jgi:hypothetical protein